MGFTYPGGKIALRGVNLDVFKGEFIGIIGNNGCGKTTLVKHFDGLLKPTDGEVFVDGVKTTKQAMGVLAAKIGYVFQNPNLQIFSNTVEDEISFGPRNLGWSEEKIKEELTSVLRLVDLENKRKDNPFFLSIGMKQRVAIASSLIMHPEVLIVDEPTTGQDMTLSYQLMELLKRLNDEGHTIIIITHDLWIVAEYTKRTIIMGEGKVVFDGPTKDIFCDMTIWERVALEPPQVVRLAQKLRINGCPGVLTVSQMCDWLGKTIC